MNNRHKLTLGTLLIFFAACTATVEKDTKEAEPKPSFSSEKTESVVGHHLEAFGQNNIDEIMTDYTAESIVITPDSTYRGLAPIRGLFEVLVPMFPTEGTQFNLAKLVVDNEVGYIVWNATTPIVEVPLGTDTYIVIDGKIVKQTFAGVINPVEAGN